MLHFLKTSWKVFRGKHTVWIKEEDTLEYYVDHHAWIRNLMVVVLGVILTLIITIFTSPAQRLIYTDDKAHAANTIVADIAFTYEVEKATEELREKARQESPLCLEMQPQINTAIVKRLHTLFKQIPLDIKTAIAYLQTMGLDAVSAENIYPIITRPNFQAMLVKITETTLYQGYVSAEFQRAYAKGRNVKIFTPPNRYSEARRLEFLSTADDLARIITHNALRKESGNLEQAQQNGLHRLLLSIFDAEHSNLILDEKRTQLDAEQNAAKVTPVVQRVQAGEQIITQGQLVNDQDLAKLRIYNQKNLENGRLNTTLIIQYALGIFFAMLITGIFVYSNCWDLYQRSHKLLTFSVIILLGVGFNTFMVANISMVSNFLGSSLTSTDLLVFAVPPILATVTLGLRAGLSAGLFISLISAIQFQNTFTLFLGGIVLSCIVCFFVVRAENYRNFFFRVFFPTLITLSVLKILLLIYSGHFHTWQTALLGTMINTMLTSVLSLLALFFLEWLLGVTTNMSLFTLTSISHPVLKELQLLAPGTYHHCVNVVTIAEQAASEIGANPLMCRVLALYHDIGKLSNPAYFTENMPTEESPHNQISPSMSAMIIRGHVSDGIERAIKYNLPKVVRDAIAQHHGTDRVSFFYQKAITEGAETSLDEKLFSYTGPLPRQKEVVIVSLADACEAATRSIERPTHAKIESMVWDIFYGRLKNGQFDDADLTFAEFSHILDSFVKTICAMRHTRITYPRSDSDDLFPTTMVTPYRTTNTTFNPTRTGVFHE